MFDSPKCADVKHVTSDAEPENDDLVVPPVKAMKVAQTSMESARSDVKAGETKILKEISQLRDCRYKMQSNPQDKKFTRVQMIDLDAINAALKVCSDSLAGILASGKLSGHVACHTCH